MVAMQRKKVICLLIILTFVSMSFEIEFAKADLVDVGGAGLIAKAPYIVSPINTTYNSSFLVLNVSFHAELAANINYSMNYTLDGGKNMTVPLASHYFGFLLRNESYLDSAITLPELQAGSHAITVYLEYILWNNVSAGAGAPTYLTYRRVYDNQTVYFTVLVNASPSPSIPEFPLWLLLSFLMAAIALGAILIRREKQSKGKAYC